jgi:hypothetical protein
LPPDFGDSDSGFEDDFADSDVAIAMSVIKGSGGSPTSKHTRKSPRPISEFRQIYAISTIEFRLGTVRRRGIAEHHWSL